MPQSWKVRPASGEVALVLPGPAAAHHRRRTVAPESNRDPSRAPEVPQDNPDLQLLDALEVRSEEGILLPGDERGSHQVPW